MHNQLTLRVTGFVASLVLTLTAFFIILQPAYFNLSIKTAVLVIFALALTQALIQLIFFINVWKEEGPLWNFWVFMSTVSIIFIIIFFSIWIITDLNYNM